MQWSEKARIVLLLFMNLQEYVDLLKEKKKVLKLGLYKVNLKDKRWNCYTIWT